ncbi:gamma-glutamyltransferase family protein [Mangrovibrevibacter kandeliae]|uniref:gamma-glutamyltransferase family protein n=1 Tax=Mangrovibrevibacter kandeliae TaxID=2968473 RepID=UPI0021177E8B|nr:MULTISPECIES: gamma-glutamyltransferase family protein [unclassified Aurantimonas]MCQ8781331.1 gamma-glutamyltransferase family protein [Aurantimonas sp. CSK15Z-1]MCW4114113.1 gamma-glutamyltransferase family protein [Aurantimonas sp. MSK8Z-1]
MTMFTTRPELLGTFGAVASTHWLATAVGMSMLERGGNAFDAGIATAFVLQVVEPHLVGPGGDVPIIFHSAKTGRTEVITGQAPAPAGATIEHYKREGLTLIPGNGLLATVIPGSFDAWMLLLRDHGTMSVRDVLEPAIYYAEKGHPVLPRVSATIHGLKTFFETEWPTSAAAFLPNGAAPEPWSLFKNPALAATWTRVIVEAESAGGDRERQIEAARNAFYKGFVAEAIDGFVRKNEAMDESGSRHKGVLTAADLAGWQAGYEAPLTYDYGGQTVNKIGPWGQGPVFLQTLALLKGFDLDATDPSGAEFIHLVTEAMKLAFADREAYYGDPAFVDVPLETLLSDAYNDERRKLIAETASFDLRPGRIAGYEAQVDRVMAVLERLSAKGSAGQSNEPTTAAMQSARRGDTVHVDAADRWGNVMAAMPSGGWLQSSPMIPELGFMLNSRAQMFWLEPDLPTSLEPGKRPRTTLTPTLTTRDGKPHMAFGSPGGDQQEQWQLLLFLRKVHHKLNLQEAIDLPMSHTTHFPTSFYPRNRVPGHLIAEANFAPAVLEELRRRGHDLEVAPEWTVGRLVAVAREADGLLRAAATPRLMQAYAIAR